MKRIKHNNLLPWFTQDHGTLPASYLKSCKKFFKELKRSSKKYKRVGPEGTSSQASSLKDLDPTINWTKFIDTLKK